ncbi:MAG: LmeA family phospholipid-binding protein, partial [Thermostichales cyanobacterium SRBZ-1_bins_19]
MIGPVYGQLLGTLLSPLVAAWIRSQVQGVEDLQVNIRGADNELLNGFIPQAQVSGRNLRYEGVAVSQVSLQGQNIRLNVPAALQGSPLQ